jgi:4-hydroxyphenylacetate 3-monooxygenase
MGARSGNNYLSALRKLKATLWLDDALVADPTIHPAFIQQARAIASLYDLQMEHPAAMTYRLDDGDRVGLSFIQPQAIDDLRKRTIMFRRWAEYTGGLLTDTPDRQNTCIAAMAAAAQFFAASEARFGENIQNYYREARRRDWCSAGAALNSATSPGLELQMFSRSDAGIVVSGKLSLMGLAPLAEELLIFPAAAPPSLDYTLVFAVGSNTPGIELRCRAATASHGSPFPEMECIATFNRVLIPWPRVFLCSDIPRCTALLDETGAAVNLMHQAVVRDIIATEFRLGSMMNLAVRCNALALPQIRAGLDEMIVATQLARSLLQDAEASALSDRWGEWLPAAQPLAIANRVLAQLDPRCRT